MISKDFPILEFDPTPRAIIEPNEHISSLDVPQHCVLTFFKEVLGEKEQITRKEGILEFVPPDSTLDQLGGLDQLEGLGVGHVAGLDLQDGRLEGLLEGQRSLLQPLHHRLGDGAVADAAPLLLGVDEGAEAHPRHLSRTARGDVAETVYTYGRKR